MPSLTALVLEERDYPCMRDLSKEMAGSLNARARQVKVVVDIYLTE